MTPSAAPSSMPEAVTGSLPLTMQRKKKRSNTRNPSATQQISASAHFFCAGASVEESMNLTRPQAPRNAAIATAKATFRIAAFPGAGWSELCAKCEHTCRLSGDGSEDPTGSSALPTPFMMFVAKRLSTPVVMVKYTVISIAMRNRITATDTYRWRCVDSFIYSVE